MDESTGITEEEKEEMMYPRFIEVHLVGEKALINVDKICVINNENVIHCGKDGTFCSDESYDELKEMLRSAGTAIQKADPRIDTSVPLTIEDLCKLDMVGEPIWNSNTLQWMLVIDSSLGDVNAWVDLCDHCGQILRFGPHEVTCFPLYRMRKNYDKIQRKEN